MASQKLIIIRGHPASGKTTVGKLLAKKGIGAFIDHNEILTFLASIVGDDEGIYKEIQSLESAMAKKLLVDKKNVIVARGFSSPDSIKPYLDIANKAGAEVHIVKLQVSNSNLRLRVSAEERKKAFNPTTSEGALSAWIAEHPLIPIEDEHEINGEDPVERVIDQIMFFTGSRSAG
jgi:shikimate kinase